MNKHQQGFVLFAVMVIITIIALVSVMLLRADMANSKWARVGMLAGVNTMKAKAWLQHDVQNHRGWREACVISGLSPAALLHQSDAWWQAHACACPGGMRVLYEPPLMSEKAVISLPTCYVAAAYWHVTMRFEGAGSAPLLLQALVAGPTDACSHESVGKQVIVPGIQQLAVVSD